jgi:hypothetical protein
MEHVMKKPVVVLLSLVLALVALVRPAQAWNGKGHMVVAYIAYQHLTPAVKKKVARLLQLNPMYDDWVKDVDPAEQGSVAFMQAATWPDAIKSAQGYITDGDAGGNRPAGDPEDSQNIGYPDHLRHKYWHFVDTPFSTDGTHLGELPTPNVETEIVLLRTALGSNVASQIRSYDLAWLEHLVGDIHQPLHAASRYTSKHPDGDAGGNLVPLCAAPCKQELHAYWDSILGSEVSVEAAIQRGEELDTEPVPAGAAVTDVHVWASDSLALAKQNAYKAPISTDTTGSTIGKPTKAYRDNARTVAEGQVILAGRRLSALINEALK